MVVLLLGEGVWLQDAWHNRALSINLNAIRLLTTVLRMIVCPDQTQQDIRGGDGVAIYVSFYLRI